MINIRIETIPNEKQRYKTIGDWFYVDLAYRNNGEEPQQRTVIRVSDLDEPKFEFLVALHELVEMFLCHERGVTEKQVDDFDIYWKGDGDPGNDPAAPYWKEHQFASVIERMMAHELGVDWQQYEKRLDEVDEGK